MHATLKLLMVLKQQLLSLIPAMMQNTYNYRNSISTGILNVIENKKLRRSNTERPEYPETG